MPNDTVRPDHLPDFRNPPLNEVVLGVQFSPPKKYQQIYAGEVWDLYRDEFPKVEEQPPLSPTFETFGLPSKGGKQLDFITGAAHDRFWFLREQGDELIQFQQDRLLHNWRKVEDKDNEYPRFESMIQRFKSELNRLENYLNRLSSQQLSINQCEISYINHISSEVGQALIASDWFRFLMFDSKEPEGFAISFREIFYDENRKPQGRLLCEAATASKRDGSRILVMNLTARGAPNGTDIQSALQFLSTGRDLIVSRFAELTTDEAHKRWGRIK